MKERIEPFENRQEQQRANAIRARLIQSRAYEAVGLRESDFRVVLRCASDADVIAAANSVRRSSVPTNKTSCEVTK